ncbi:hypothetical protein SADUNF_Sadunf10G0177300 [Salix dunnii]|uniref:Stigma-specific STIG1-like protein 1 n=1 Tax=Salix dunnii TaxID=1413687 RepID=A0A835MQ87_9ROSI|nr:hypothetical protein SADUNF_Sadunf10G0177300 [Salix dunnii]
MKFMHFFLVLSTINSLILDIASFPLQEDQLHYNTDNEVIENFSSHQSRGVSRFLAQHKRSKNRRLTCNKFSRICHAKGSPGPHCCKKKCVNVLTDRLNCGLCGKKCRYNDICCNGKCVNPSSSRRHCGACNSSCDNGSLCVLGLCNYA